MLTNIIVTIKKTTSLFLAFILVVGTIPSISPFMIGAQADSYLEMENNYEKSYGNDNIDKSKDSSSKSVTINKVNCNNNNVNINGNNTGDINVGINGAAERYLGGYSSDGSGEYDVEGYSKQGKGFDCIINNNNTNTNIGGDGGGGGNQTIPPVPVTSLTVKKQVFGCDNISSPGGTSITMNCLLLQNNSSAPWLDCNGDNPDISGTEFCQSLPESIFDIEVLDDQNTLIQEFVGSEQGTTIQNLQPGTYTVNEIKQLSGNDQLTENPFTEEDCISLGFTDGGNLINSTANIGYSICFEYEDEQGNDCSTITLAVEEERTCTVKNYINTALGFLI